MNLKIQNFFLKLTRWFFYDKSLLSSSLKHSLDTDSFCCQGSGHNTSKYGARAHWAFFELKETREPRKQDASDLLHPSLLPLISLSPSKPAIKPRKITTWPTSPESRS